MTYHEDVAVVKDSFKKMLEKGLYKADLFSDLWYTGANGPWFWGHGEPWLSVYRLFVFCSPERPAKDCQNKALWYTQGR